MYRIQNSLFFFFNSSLGDISTMQDIRYKSHSAKVKCARIGHLFWIIIVRTISLVELAPNDRTKPSRNNRNDTLTLSSGLGKNGNCFSSSVTFGRSAIVASVRFFFPNRLLDTKTMRFIINQPSSRRYIIVSHRSRSFADPNGHQIASKNNNNTCTSVWMLGLGEKIQKKKNGWWRGSKRNGGCGGQAASRS